MTVERHRMPARAVWFSGRECVEILYEGPPIPGPNDIRVHALASGISQGTELMVLRGLAPASLPLDLPTLEGTYDFPIKFGYASVGRVVERGRKVRHPARGDLVFVHHPHQTEYVVPAVDAVVLDPHADAAVGTLLANMETAVNVVWDAEPRLGEHAVVFGQGIVGLLVARLLMLAGTRVTAVEPHDERRKTARTMGISVLASIDVEEERAHMHADLAVECSGNPGALNTAISCLAMEGRVVVASWYGLKRASIDLGGAFHRKRLRLISSQVGSIPSEMGARWDRRRRIELARDLLSQLDLNPLITHRVPFEEAWSLYKLLLDNPGSAVHAVLTYDDTDV
ncbi:MAG TPA: zinc-binding alcohol dehydrogenase [Chloroflexota bacterium]|nr:zinc-binding alcohol dehydrogenase [Chloroflexota bacterium]